MNRNKIKSKFYNILKYQLCLEDKYFSRFSDDGENILITELGIDALDWYEILSQIEYEFNIIIRDKDLSTCKFLYDFINLIKNCINKQK